MKRFVYPQAVVSIILCLLLINGVSAQDKPQIDKADLLNRAQKQYYNLRAAGVAELTCKVNVNWLRLLKDLNDTGNDPEGVSLDMLKPIQFSMSLGANDQFNLEHTPYPLIPDKETQDNVRMLVDDSTQMVGSFVSAWRQFVLTPIFPEVSSVQSIEETDDGYRVRATDGDIKTNLVMSKEMVISNISVSSLLLTGTTSPAFIKTQKGLLLNRLDSNIGDGQIKSVIDIDYQEVDGIQVLKSVLYNSTDRGERHIIELSFSDYSIKKK